MPWKSSSGSAVWPEREVGIRLQYRGQPLRTRYRADYVVDGVLVELKAQSALTAIDEAQVIHYLNASGRDVALLVNFGSADCEVRRFVGNSRLAKGQVSVESV